MSIQAPVNTPGVFPLLRLPLELRKRVFYWALKVEFIQYYRRPIPKPFPNHGTYGHAHLDYISDYMARGPRFEVSDPRLGHARFRPLTEQLSLLLVCRQVYNEVAPLLLEDALFYVSDYRCDGCPMK